MYNPLIWDKDEGLALQEMVDYPNTFVIIAVGNVSSDALAGPFDFSLECHQKWIERGMYKGSSIQGKHSFGAVGGELETTEFGIFEENHAFFRSSLSQFVMFICIILIISRGISGRVPARSEYGD